MAKVIALFNNKGGVSKTTTTFHLGWILAERGYNTLIVDTDPQCNLTGISKNTSRNDRLEDLYNADITNIKDGIAPVLEGALAPIVAANCYHFPQRSNLSLLPGHIELSKYDTDYSVTQGISGALSMTKNIPGAIRELLRATIEKDNLDFVIIDMSPSISALNANILMQSDYFIIPCAPDYFCYMAIKSLSNILPLWNKQYTDIRNSSSFSDAQYKVRETPPQFMGTIQQRYRPRNGAPARAFAEWIDDINAVVRNTLVPRLAAVGMIPENIDSIDYETPYNLISIADFNSLIAHSQDESVPVFCLTQEQVQRSGKVWENMKQSIDDFHNVFNALADRVINITGV